MNFRPVTEHEWRGVQSSLGLHERIRTRATNIVTWLGVVFNDSEPGGVAGLEFQSQTDDDIICQVVTPVGKGRMRLDWTLINNDLHGLLVVEKVIRDEFDKPRWIRVWQLNIPEASSVFVATPDDGYSLRPIGRQRENDVFSIGMGILFAIVNGPVTC